MTTRSERPAGSARSIRSERSIRSDRARLLARADLTGPRLRTGLTEMFDSWLGGLLPPTPGVALLAVGGLGRREPTPYGDLDLVLLHDGKVAELSSVADSLWYPIWDAGVGLDHSVRTPQQALAVASDDLKALLGMLDARHIAGDPALTGLVREQAISRWRSSAPSKVAQLQELARSRWASRGEASFLLEPDLKDSRGGLRDWVGLRALASAHLLDVTPAMLQAGTVLLDVRGELHRLSGRSADVLRAQDRDSVARALGLQGPDEALRAVHEAARTLAYATDVAWRRVAAAHSRPSRSLLRRLRPGEPSGSGPGLSERKPLAKDVVAQGGEVVLARDADPWADPALTLRVARAAATADLPISAYALSRLATEGSALPEPWPAAARDEFVALLGTGAQAVSALEALDQHGLLSRLLPEWENVRFKAQHNPVHLFTVDRHLIETAVRASALAAEVARPDLLLVGALLHDIGKGYPGDHSVTGAALAGRIATRMGFTPADAATVAALTRHHLLLPDTATRRDLEDPSTVLSVVTAIGNSVELLELLHCLTIADAGATGPAAWSDWKASLVSQLVRRAGAVLGGGQLPPAQPPSEAVLRLARRGGTEVLIEGGDVLVVAPDAAGLLSNASGLLALHSLDVQAAEVRTVRGMAVNRFTVSPRFGQLPDPALLNADLRRILAGTLALDERLRVKERAYRNSEDAGHTAQRPPRLLWFDDEATDATVLEVRARDAIGLLHWLTAALERAGADIRSARISSLGAHVVDAFYLTDADGKSLSPAHQERVAEAIETALSG
ncbi:MAG TPA: [protein-PII] uridylyltransferase [Jatrophihabitans sp.]|jgi:[protein-PII] uridylyltransferase|uniref:[protein-PII] uridylyltransferase n=1 Tax=Jatrophihabitans sp. TaxID=1932789 RepID=UPI002EE995EA